MSLDIDKIDECALSFLLLTSFQAREDGVLRAWNKFPEDTLERLHKKGFIIYSKDKTDSVVLTETGLAMAMEMINKHLSKGARRIRRAATKGIFAYRFKVTLQGIRPPIWRRIEVPAEYSFWDLHVAIQDSMGWKDCHLHRFKVTNPDTGIIDKMGIPDHEFLDEKDIRLADWKMPIVKYFMKPGDKTEYCYDFGDGWKHQVVLERIVSRSPGAKYPLSLAGERACPPEDCGGVIGYKELLHILRTPSHKEHKRMLTWVGGRYDPEKYDPEKVHFGNPKKRWEIAFRGE